MGQTVRPIITSGTVAAGGVLISAVDGTAFIDVDTSKTGASDFSTAILAAVTHNDVIELTSKTNGKKIYGYAKAAGTGTLGTDNLGAEKSSGTLTIGMLYKITATEENHFFTGCAIGNYFTATAATTCDANNKVQQITAPSAIGVTVTNTIGGTTYNFGLKDSAFTYNDTAGYDYRIISSTAYGKLIATQSPVSGTLHIATKDGEAMFFHDSIDFSAYAGTDAGSTPYLFVFYDNAGKSASAFAGAAGGGEALGGELITSWTNSGTKPYETFTTSGKDITSAVNSTGEAYAYTNTVLSSGKLYYLSTNTTINSGNGSNYRAQVSNTIITTMGAGVKTSYYTSKSNDTHLSVYNGGAGNWSATFSLKALTDIAATGLHLMSAKDGTTRNMKSVESGFNPNTITRVNIYRAY